MRKYKISETLFFDCEAELEMEFQEYPPRVEEGHGLHTFDEDEEIGKELKSFKILLDSGEELDIISVLTDEMKKKISDCL